MKPDQEFILPMPAAHVSDSDLPRISIVIPVRNMAESLARCLESIAAQEYPNIEVLVMDAMSTDDIAVVLRSYGFLNIVHVREPDSGQPEAVTKGLMRATGEIFHWHGADDLLMAGALRHVAALFRRHPRVDLFFSDNFSFDGTRVYRGWPRWGARLLPTLLFFDRFESESAYWRSGITARALPLNRAMALNCDEDFFLRLWVGSHFCWTGRQLGAFGIRKGQLSRTLNQNNLARDRATTRREICHQLGFSPLRIVAYRAALWPLYQLTRWARVAWLVGRKFFTRMTGDDRRRAAEAYIHTIRDRAAARVKGRPGPDKK